MRKGRWGCIVVVNMIAVGISILSLALKSLTNITADSRFSMPGFVSQTKDTFIFHDIFYRDDATDLGDNGDSILCLS